MDGPVERPVRVGVSYPAVVVRASGEEQSVTITNVSSDGFSVDGQKGLTGGERVHLRLADAGTIHAEIRWAAASRAGGVFFDKPVVP